MKGLEGKVALITGGGRGVGRSLALALSARGVRLIVTGRNERSLGETVGEVAHGGGKARHVVGDVRDPSHLSAAALRAVETFGALDFAIAAAGQSLRVEPGADSSHARVAELLAINVMGVYCTFEAALRQMKGPGKLLVANLREVPWDCSSEIAGYAPYVASKAAVFGLVQRTAHELAPRKITCNAVISGSEDTFDRVAELGAYLCSSSGDAMTGQTIAVTG